MLMPKPNRRSGQRVPFLESKPWRELRATALRRDGYRCVICGADISGSGRARVDHVQPRSLRPDLALVLSNTRSLCPRCDNQSHREKGQQIRTGQRNERISGSNRAGVPLDPKHHWNVK